MTRKQRARMRKRKPKWDAIKAARLQGLALRDPDPAAMPLQAFHNLDQAAFAIFKTACGNEIINRSEMSLADFRSIAHKSFQAADVFFEIRRSR